MVIIIIFLHSFKTSLAKASGVTITFVFWFVLQKPHDKLATVSFRIMIPNNDEHGEQDASRSDINLRPRLQFTATARIPFEGDFLIHLHFLLFYLSALPAIHFWCYNIVSAAESL
mmetsp:Transcript_99158/g.201166  ORF Transcript_99158/g.201166 Transcript_99158/m.201166 type:complete len:115 (+) Transcript_99158:1148-1492(+)